MKMKTKNMGSKQILIIFKLLSVYLFSNVSMEFQMKFSMERILTKFIWPKNKIKLIFKMNKKNTYQKCIVIKPLTHYKLQYILMHIDFS